MSVWKNYKSSIILFLGMFIGSVVGAYMGKDALVFKPIANLFLNLLYCATVPLILFSMISSIANMKSGKKLGKILLVMFILFVITGVIAAIYMIGVMAIFDPALGSNIVFDEGIQDLKSNSDFLSMLTVDDFYLLLSRKNLMALIVFAIGIGVALSSLKEKGKPVVEIFNILTEVILKGIGYIMIIAPIGLGAFFATLVGEQGAELAGPLSRAIIIYFIAALVYFVFMNTIMAGVGGGVLGIKNFWKSVLPPTLTSLGTCSSAASIPVNLVASQQIGMSDEIKNISIPMGANLHKDGAVMIQILKIAFVCSILNIDFLDFNILTTGIFVAVFASIVMGAIPSGGFVGEIFIISAFGFPAVSIPIMVLIGTITDAPATAINVTTDVSAGMILDRYFGEKELS